MVGYDELKALIEKRGVHPQLGSVGEGWNIEHNSHELATFLIAMQALGVQSVLEIGTGYKAGLSRFLAQEMGWQVTSLDIVDYGHIFEGITYLLRENYRFEHPFDLVFIDANHDYEFVVNDHRTYKSLATKAVAFHDIGGFRGCEGVAQYWREIAYNPNGVLKKNYFEVLAANYQGAGIGWYLVNA